MKPLFNADDFARRLRVRMAELGIDMLEAARQMSVSHATVSRVCNAKMAPGVENYLRMQRWLDKAKLTASRLPQHADNN